MPESIPAPLIIDTVKDTFKEARAALAKEGVRSRHDHLGRRLHGATIRFL